MAPIFDSASSRITQLAQRDVFVQNCTILKAADAQ